MSAGKTICPFEDMVMVAMVFSQSIFLHLDYSTTAYHVRNDFDVLLKLKNTHRLLDRP